MGVGDSVGGSSACCFCLRLISLAEVDEFADRVVVINQGHVVADGTPAEIRSYARGSTLRATVNDAWTSEQIEERLAELRALDSVSAVSLHGIRLEISAADADAVASHLLADGFAKNLEITSSSLDDAFVLLTRPIPKESARMPNNT